MQETYLGSNLSTLNVKLNIDAGMQKHSAHYFCSHCSDSVLFNLSVTVTVFKVTTVLFCNPKVYIRQRYISAPFPYAVTSPND